MECEAFKRGGGYSTHARVLNDTASVIPRLVIYLRERGSSLNLQIYLRGGGFLSKPFNLFEREVFLSKRLNVSERRRVPL